MELLQSAITIVLFFVILGTLVVIHEIGHFVTARLSGVRVLEFGIGFPPRAKVLRSRGETLYTLNWLPIGGFVKLEGEDGDEAGDPRSFVNARLPVKLVILVSGVLMNVLLAFVIFTLIAWVATPLVGARVDNPVEPGSPAAELNLEPGDGIRSIDGQRFEIFDNQFGQVLRSRAGQVVTFVIERSDGTLETASVRLRPPEEISEEVGPLGIGRFSGYPYGEYVGRDLPSAVRLGAELTAGAMALILNGLGQLVESIRTDPTAEPPAAGPIGIAVQIGDVFWQLGPVITLYMAGVLSANLAVVNILPFPPLDGGRMLVILLKALFGRRISVQAERLTYLVGFVFLFAFLIWITGFDIARTISESR